MKKNEISKPDQNKGKFLVYEAEDGQLKIDVRLQDETVWLTQKVMAELFQVKPQNITMHLKNVYEECELIKSSTCKDLLQVQFEGGREVKRTQKFYNFLMLY